MRVTSQVLVSAFALFPSLSLQHAAIMPPTPDKALHPNSTTTPEGCKKLASDKEWPSDATWRKAFPGVFHKLKGTMGPDYMVQAKNVADVQAVVNFAREQNVRLTIISTGHDFGQRNTGRSGIRLDLGSLREPTVFANEWKCGDTLKPQTITGRTVEHHEVETCKVPRLSKRGLSTKVPQRNYEFRHFEKRDGWDCGRLLMRHKKRQHDGMAMGGLDAMPNAAPGPGMTVDGKPSPAMDPAEVAGFNVIKPTGKTAYARVSGGMYNELFWTQADKSGLMNAGAQHGGVSVTGGWFQAGGHNPFVNKIGMAVDNVVEIEVVTADGKFQKVSECNNPELFWALRGGGGSTFGVITAITTKVHQTFPVVVSRFFVNSTKPDGIMDATSLFLQEGSKLRDNNGLMGYFYVYPQSFQSAMHMPMEFATLENAKNVTNYLMKKMETLAGSEKHIEPQYYQYKTYREWYTAEYGDDEMEEKGQLFLSWNDGSDGPVPGEAPAMDNPYSTLPWQVKYPSTGYNKRSLDVSDLEARAMDSELMTMGVMRSQPNSRHYLDSRLLSDKHVNSVDIKRLSAAIKETMPDIPGIHIRGFLYGGGAQAKPGKDDMGLVPSWRDMSYHFITNSVPGLVRHDYNISALSRLFPDAGGYVNEAAPGEPNWKVAYWGDHYPKLEAIKRKVDPQNVFWCSPCVGADLLTYDDERLCRNMDYSATKLVEAPQTYWNKNSKQGIAAIPGDPGIPDPKAPIIQDYLQSKQAPKQNIYKSSYFKIAMGEGGSAGGKYADMDPYNKTRKLSDASS